MELSAMSTDMVTGMVLGVGIPILLWAMRLFYLVKQTRDMHLDPDKYGFGSARLESLLSENLGKLDDHERDYLSATKALRYAIKELSHYTKWSVTERTGKEPPPYVRVD